MTGISIMLPIVIPLTSAALQIIAWRRRGIQKTITVISTTALLLAALFLLVQVRSDGIQTIHIGGWQAPFGVTMVADLFSALMVVLAAIIGLAATIYSLGSIDNRREVFGYYPLMSILLMGVNGAFLTGDLFNLYVWFEVMLMASFVLLTLGGEKPQLLGGIKYVALNLLSSAIFLAALGLLYGTVGTVNMADLARKLPEFPQPGLLTALACLFLVAFGIKAGVFPLFFWLPASYHTPPVAVSAVFAGLLTKVGVYALIRVFTLIFTHDQVYINGLLLIIAGLTMLVGVFGAVAQNGFRRVLSFHIISQIGYMVMGLALNSPLAIAGALFYITHHIIVKSNLFMISGIVKQQTGTEDLQQLGGLYRAQPLIAILFSIPAMSLAGIPPFSGFFAKLVLIQAGLQTEQYLIVAVAIFVSLLTLFSMTKIWNEAFWKPAPAKSENPGVETNPSPAARPPLSLLAPVAALAALTLVIGFGAEPILNLTTEAASQLLNPAGYIEVVMGGRL
ncbi:MAG: Na+/H+ antiporter subunit D [Chloroflexi bacterium]|jgi:multicomponent Na+:H+ antiporter subunit D|nr:Na+/H+ antiporter subunit D [Chloroflexota bacterium]